MIFCLPVPAIYLCVIRRLSGNYLRGCSMVAVRLRYGYSILSNCNHSATLLQPYRKDGDTPRIGWGYH